MNQFEIEKRNENIEKRKRIHVFDVDVVSDYFSNVFRSK